MVKRLISKCQILLKKKQDLYFWKVSFVNFFCISYSIKSKNLFELASLAFVISYSYMIALVLRRVTSSCLVWVWCLMLDRCLLDVSSMLTRCLLGVVCFHIWLCFFFYFKVYYSLYTWEIFHFQLISSGQSSFSSRIKISGLPTFLNVVFSRNKHIFFKKKIWSKMLSKKYVKNFGPLYSLSSFRPFWSS